MQKAPSMQQQVDQQTRDRKWLSLGLARRLLDINEATLRQWADNGLVRACRTPGGHRRFYTDDLHALIESGNRGPGANVHIDGDSNVLPRIRRRLKANRAHSPSWMNKFDAPGLDRMRSLGRGLLDLCLEYLDSPHR